ncbi:MAG: siderophore-interacting protein [Rothia sp. (in: high G+C Gram-positive bacteria)]|uniref:siderophore-interacting protein n=1 Tax=Rothia sp. (in: high G+C Gram-positive bacteria) TaxID=1885016 RepID=UPI002710EC7B|nr:siderophore-interacting protein [Rothia sp. (in: high G+C Gram-positive bacteria)]
MGSTKSKDKDAKEQLKSLKAELKYLKKGQKQLLKRVEKLEKALAAGQGSALATSPAPAPARTSVAGGSRGGAGASYPQPMKSGKYRGGYSHYRVTEVGQLTPTVMRVVAEPADSKRVEAQGLVGEYIYLVTGKKGEVLPAPTFEKDKAQWSQPTTTAKYTVRNFDENTGALEINIMLHEHGAGTTWARTVAVGDSAHFLGAKSGYSISKDYDFYLLAGDESGLPGMARWIESLPASARGVAVIEVPGEASQQVIAAPENFEVVWVDSARHGALAETVMAYPLPEGSVCTWLAGESRSIHPLRIWARRELSVPKGHGYAKGYWKKK